MTTSFSGDSETVFLSISYAIDWMMLIFSIPATILNVTMGAIGIFLARKTDAPVHIFVANMAIGDGILTSSYPIARLVTLKYISGRIYFYLTTPVWLGVSLSAISLILLNIDRFVFFHWVLKYRYLMTIRGAYVISGIAWLISLSHTAIGIALLSEPHHNLSALNASHEYSIWTDDPEIHRGWYLAHGIVFGLFPVLSSFLLSTWLITLRQRKSPDLGVRPSSSRQESSNWKLLRFIVVTTVWSTIALLPSRIYVYFCQWLGKDIERDLFLFLINLTYLNPIVNPLVTLYLQNKYLTVLKNWIVFAPLRKQSYGGSIISSTTPITFRKSTSRESTPTRKKARSTRTASAPALDPLISSVRIDGRLMRSYKERGSERHV